MFYCNVITIVIETLTYFYCMNSTAYLK